MKSLFANPFFLKALQWLPALLAVLIFVSTVTGYPFKEYRSIQIPVLPAKNTLLSKEPIQRFGNAALYMGGALEMTDAKWYQRIMLSHRLLEDIGMLCIALFLLKMYRNEQAGKSFQQNLAKDLARMGSLFLVIYLLERIQWHYQKNMVADITLQGFSPKKNFGSFLPNTFIAIIFLLFSRIYQKGYELKKEQDLTI